MEPVQPCKPKFPRPFGLALAAAVLAVTAGCPSQSAAVAERDAETLFVRGATFSFHETAVLECRMRDVAAFVPGERITLTGVGLVVGLDGTGDKGSDFDKALAYLQTMPDLRAPEGTVIEAGRVALVMVESHVIPEQGAAGGIAGASVRPVGGAATLEGGTLLWTDLVEARTGEVFGVALGPVLTSTVDAEGNRVPTPRLGRLLKVQIKGRPRPGAKRILRFAPHWDALLEAASRAVKKAFPHVSCRVLPPDRLEITLPSDPEKLPVRMPEKTLDLPLSAPSGGLPRLILDAESRGVLGLGDRLYFGRGTFMTGGDLKVISLAPKGPRRPPRSAEEPSAPGDGAIVEVGGEDGRSIVTVRWLRHVVRVADRLGVAFETLVRLLKGAAESGALGAEIIEAPGWLEKSSKKEENPLKKEGGWVR